MGWPLIIFGIGLCTWCVIEAQEMNIANPNILLTSGPYALSRNPMYVGWALIYSGISLVINSVWLLSLLPVVIVYLHFVDIQKEEQLLIDLFGDVYRQYRRRVRRYF